MSVKDWILAIPQVGLAVTGIYCIYQALIVLQGYGFDNFGAPAGFVSSISLGVILFGLAALLQEIRKYIAHRRSLPLV
ncbi:MAG TPA: hypothetical protein VMT42_06305 [candidate division Zixibacteria bacterium]|nr:hypothetical protein [candidate division Zixibacteria bacterium]